jgi:hypothetical protein
MIINDLLHDFVVRIDAAASDCPGKPCDVGRRTIAALVRFKPGAIATKNNAFIAGRLVRRHVECGG